MTKPTEKENVIFLLPPSALFKLKSNPGAVLWQSVANASSGTVPLPCEVPTGRALPRFGDLAAPRVCHIHQGPADTRIKEFPVSTSLNCSVHTGDRAAGGPGLGWASALHRQGWEKGFPGCWRILQQQRANIDPLPLFHLPGSLSLLWHSTQIHGLGGTDPLLRRTLYSTSKYPI